MLSYCLPFPHFPWVLGTLLCIRADQEPTRLAFSPAHGGGGMVETRAVLPFHPKASKSSCFTCENRAKKPFPR